ncbi:MAG: NRDE family protein [Bacteroidetes bacterium]|nr:NRDE family protein [Bacteroidota bacterium]
MCTLSYIPLSHNDYILTSNRDEKYERKSALSPQLYNIKGVNVAYPKDLEKNGTWIAMSDNCYTLCLFNGANTPHKPMKSYKRSRGLILLDFFNYNNINQFLISTDFKGVEPFTLVIIQYVNQIKLFEIVWNGKQIQIFYKDANKPHIWSSVMIYESEIRIHRKKMFDDFINKNNETTFEKEILNFHKNKDFTDKKQNLIIKTEIVSTVSITQVLKNGLKTEMKYHDLKIDKTAEISVDLALKNNNT